MQKHLYKYAKPGVNISPIMGVDAFFHHNDRQHSS